MNLNPQTVLNFFFSPQGRLARLPYAMAMAGFWVVVCIAGLLVGLRLVEPLSIFLLFPAVCLAARRWHDFNCRGWWWALRFAPLPVFVLLPHPYTYLAVQLVPLLVLIVECIIPGSKGPNRFGAVPAGLVVTRKAKTQAKPTRAKAKPAKPKAKKKK